MTPNPSPAELLDHLADEERLLAESLAGLLKLTAALRSGDPVAIADATDGADLLAAAAADRATARQLAADELAQAVGLPAGATLAALAAALPGHAAALLDARARLAGLAAEVRAAERRNANLVRHLRSYFRGVMAVLTAADAPTRYGRTGANVAPPPAGTLLARG